MPGCCTTTCGSIATGASRLLLEPLLKLNDPSTEKLDLFVFGISRFRYHRRITTGNSSNGSRRRRGRPTRKPQIILAQREDLGARAGIALGILRVRRRDKMLWTLTIIFKKKVRIVLVLSAIHRQCWWKTEESMNRGFCDALPLWVDPIIEREGVIPHEGRAVTLMS
jgi:hypothetical protein